MSTSRPLDRATLVLVPLMFLSFCCAVAAGILQILWTGHPTSQTAANVSFVFAFVFGGAFFLSLLLAAYEECHVANLKQTDPNEFGAEV